MSNGESGLRVVGQTISILLLICVAACSSNGPPEFSVEHDPPSAGSQETSRSFSIGTLVTPPPGEYRFVRLHADGRAEIRELLTFNGPGPWLAYVGRAAVPALVARDALAAIDATPPASAPGDDRAPCVMAFDSATTDTWEGCAYPAVAERVLSEVPRLSPPEMSATCLRPACQVRLVTEVLPTRHERTGDVLQDIVFDEDGPFWCAARGRSQQGQTITMRVERGTVSRRHARDVFEWLLPGGEETAGGDQSPPMSDGVEVRGRASGWTRVRTQDARAVRLRWRRLAERLPTECRLND